MVTTIREHHPIEKVSSLDVILNLQACAGLSHCCVIGRPVHCMVTGKAMHGGLPVNQDIHAI